MRDDDLIRFTFPSFAWKINLTNLDVFKFRIHIREQLYISWCNLAARCLIKDPLMNSKFRNILGKALEEFPSSPPLLLLFTDVEVILKHFLNCNTSFING